MTIAQQSSSKSYKHDAEVSPSYHVAGLCRACSTPVTSGHGLHRPKQLWMLQGFLQSSAELQSSSHQPTDTPQLLQLLPGARMYDFLLTVSSLPLWRFMSRTISTPHLVWKWINEWCFRPQFCTTGLYWARDRIERSSCCHGVQHATTVPRLLLHKTFKGLF